MFAVYRSGGSTAFEYQGGCKICTDHLVGFEKRDRQKGNVCKTIYFPGRFTYGPAIALVQAVVSILKTKQVQRSRLKLVAVQVKYSFCRKAIG